MKEVRRPNPNSVTDYITDNSKLRKALHHNIKTPLTSILGFIELAQDDIRQGDYDNLSENLEVALTSSLRLKDEVQQFFIVF